MKIVITEKTCSGGTYVHISAIDDPTFIWETIEVDTDINYEADPMRMAYKLRDLSERIIEDVRLIEDARRKGRETLGKPCEDEE